MRERIPLLAGFLALALAIGLGSVAVANGIRDRGSIDSVSVTGSAKQRITSDYVIWESSLAAQAPTPQAALRQLAAWGNELEDFLQAEGARADELTIRPISTETLTDPDDGNVVTGYRLSRLYVLRSSRVAGIAEIAEQAPTLLGRGVPISPQAPQYVFTKLAALRPRLIAEATKDAQDRARALIEATEGTLGRLQSVGVGVFQITTPNSTDVSDYGVYDTSTVEKDVTAVVNASFAVE